MDPIEWERTLPIRPSSPAWCASVRGIYGSPLTPDERALFLELSGGREPPEGGTDEAQITGGRRGGKSETIARVATFEAGHGGHDVALAPGQVGVVAVISPLREQSAEIMNYARGLAALPQVRPLLDGEPTRDAIRFRSGVEIRVMTADAVAVSGATVVCAIRDEHAKFPGSDAAGGGDVEIDNSLRPALAPVRGAPRRRLIGISSAYLTEGVAYTTDRDNYGRADAPVLALRGTTVQFNPNIDLEWLEKQRRRVGERVFAREYLGVWQDAIVESWFGADVIEQSIDRDRGVLAPVKSIRYFAGLDLGLRVDGAALAIVHRERRDGVTYTIVDGVWHWPSRSASLDAIVTRSAKIIREYKATTFADQFAFDAVKDQYARHSVYLREGAWTATGGRSKTVRFHAVRGEMIDSRIRLPDDRDLIREFHSLAGKLRRSGTEELAARTGHDDRLHATVLALSEALEHQPDRRPRYSDWSFADYHEAKQRHAELARVTGNRWFHPVFDNDGTCLSYEQMLAASKAGDI